MGAASHWHSLVQLLKLIPIEFDKVFNNLLFVAFNQTRCSNKWIESLFFLF
jgi:hypothetical protein